MTSSSLKSTNELPENPGPSFWADSSVRRTKRTFWPLVPSGVPTLRWLRSAGVARHGTADLPAPVELHGSGRRPEARRGGPRRGPLPAAVGRVHQEAVD